MSTHCGDYNSYYRDGRCQPRQASSIFYFVTSIVALLILTSVVLFCVCCVCLRRRRLWSALHASGSAPGPPIVGTTNAANVTYPGTVLVTDDQGDLEEGRLSGNQPKRSPGVCVIMPGEAEVTFIAQPSSPIRASAKDKTDLNSSFDEPFLAQQPPKSS